MKIWEFIKAHRLASVASFFVGIMVVLPTLLSVYGSDFGGIYPTFIDDEEHYLAMVRDVVDGHPFSGNVFLSEGKNRPFMQPALMEYLFGLFSLSSGIEISQIYAINDFWLPALFAIILYTLIYMLSRSSVFSFVFVIFVSVLFLPDLGRPINMQVSLPIFVFGLFLLLKTYHEDDPESIDRSSYFLACLIGLSVYVSLYVWTTLIVFYFLLLFWRLVFDRYDIKSVITSGSKFLSIFLMISAPYFVNLYSLMAEEYYLETASRYGLLLTYVPGAFKNIFLVLLGLFLLFVSRRFLDKKDIGFFVTLMISLVVVNWQNVITGKYLQFSSHYFDITLLSLLLIIAVIFSRSFILRENRKNMYWYFTVVSLFLVLGFVVWLQKDSIYKSTHLLFNSPNIEYLQGTRPILNWLNDNTKPGDVVLVLKSEYIPLVPVYTHNNTYFDRYAGYYLGPDQELEERFVIKNIFLSNKIDKNFVLKNQGQIWSNKFIDRFQKNKNLDRLLAFLGYKKYNKFELVPQEYVDRILTKYELIKKEDIKNVVERYKLDYILVDKNNLFISEINNEGNFFKLVAEFDQVDIYEVI